jgi:hypothetical protein
MFPYQGIHQKRRSVEISFGLAPVRADKMTVMNQPTIHFRGSGTLSICGAQLSQGETHPGEINEDTERTVTCPKCRDIAIAPRNIEHRAGNFRL